MTDMNWFMLFKNMRSFYSGKGGVSTNNPSPVTPTESNYTYNAGSSYLMV